MGMRHGGLRVRIVIDLAKPLDRGRKINIKNKSTWVAFKYETVPNFCYQCGVVRQGMNGCEVQGNGDMQGDSPFGPWLKVPHVYWKRRGDDEFRGTWCVGPDQ
jgi:hypothetical protein